MAVRAYGPQEILPSQRLAMLSSHSAVTRHRILTIALIAVVLTSFLTTLPVRAATQTLGGGVASGLTVTVQDTGQMNVAQYAAGAWRDWTPSKGSALRINGTTYTMGYFSGTPATAVSNTTVGNTITTVQTAGGTQIVQKTTFVPGTNHYSIQWYITNTGASSLSDLRLFHGEDSNLKGSGGAGSGWWIPSINSIGVSHVEGVSLLDHTNIEWRMKLQGITTPYAYESDGSSNVFNNGSAGALSNVVDPNVGTDNGYALEWRQASLAPGTTWTVSAVEHAIGLWASPNPFWIVGPITTVCATGVACDLTYTVRNISGSNISTQLTLNSDLSWGQTIVSPASPTTVAAGGSTSVTVRVTPPNGTATGTIGIVAIVVTDGINNYTSAGTYVSALGPPAAPTVTNPVTGSHTNTTPTVSGTAEADTTVTVKDGGGTTLCAATANGLGNWSCTTSALSDGSNTISVTATNEAGSGSATTRTFTVDLTVLTTPDATLYDSAGGTPVVVSPNLSATGSGTLDGALVMISANFTAGDSLGIQGQVGSSGTVSGLNWSYNSTTGVLTLSSTGTDTLDTYQSVLRQVTFSSSASSSLARTVKFSLGSSLPNPSNGHYYEYCLRS